MKKISVAIATYNGGRFLREQLDSLYRQTRLPDEVVVSDDGSTDETLAILEEYHQRYGLRYTVNDTHRGVNDNFLHLFSLCTGDYVCICDQDDIWMENKIETHYEIIRHQREDIPIAVASTYIDIDKNGVQIGQPIRKSQTDDWRDTLISTSSSQGCSMMMNRTLVDTVLRLYASHESARLLMYDVLVSTTAAALGKKINTYIPLMYYRRHDANVIGRYRAGRKPWREKVQDVPHYYPFLMDYRIEELARVHQILKEEKPATDIANFLKQMNKLYEADNMLQGLKILWQLPYISFSRKCRISCLTPMSFTLKRLYGL